MKRADMITLRRGVRAWNLWRKNNPAVVPSLDGAILSGMDLGRADLRRAEMRDVYFNTTNLAGAQLQDAKSCCVCELTRIPSGARR